MKGEQDFGDRYFNLKDSSETNTGKTNKTNVGNEVDEPLGQGLEEGGLLNLTEVIGPNPGHEGTKIKTSTLIHDGLIVALRQG